jgi:hypothetical protein
LILAGRSLSSGNLADKLREAGEGLTPSTKDDSWHRAKEVRMKPASLSASSFLQEDWAIDISDLTGLDSSYGLMIDLDPDSNDIALPSQSQDVPCQRTIT